MSLLYETLPHLINSPTRIILITPMHQSDFGVSNPVGFQDQDPLSLSHISGQSIIPLFGARYR
jgi:hypothetical protein